MVVVGCFECFGSCEICGSKLASGAWFLLFFQVTAVTLDTIFAISGVQKNLSFGGLLPPFSYPGDHFVSLGAPWETMGAAGRTRGGPKQDFY
jgi:hypothetical protein